MIPCSLPTGIHKWLSYTDKNCNLAPNKPLMELAIVLQKEDYKQGVIHLKKDLDKSAIEGLSGVTIDRMPAGANEQGAGAILNSIKVVILAAQKPLVELIKCLQKYVDNYRTRITIPRQNGKDIIIEHGRSMSPEELRDLIASILEKNP